MATVHDILSVKGRTLHAISGEASVLDATRKMNEHQVGALVIEDDQQQVVGIFTERDVLRRVVAEQQDPAQTHVKDVMTTQVICCEPDTDLVEVQRLMKSRRIRHVPVVDSGRVLGLISIGDVNGYFASDQEVHVHYLHDYIYGRV